MVGKSSIFRLSNAIYYFVNYPVKFFLTLKQRGVLFCYNVVYIKLAMSHDIIAHGSVIPTMLNEYLEE